jgi:hypothetical protein
MRALRKLPHRARESDRSHRQAAGDRLRDTEDVGNDLVLLEREHRPGPAEPRLDLVEDEQHAALAAQSRGRIDELACRGPHAAFALHELDDESSGLGRDRSVKRFGLVEGNV